MTFARGSIYRQDKKEFFICETQEQLDTLTARGWTVTPSYPAGDAVWIKDFPEEVEVIKPTDAPKRGRPRGS